MARRLALLVVMLVIWACPVFAQGPQPPLTQDEVRDLIKTQKKDPDAIYRTLSERGVDFDLNREIEKKMRKAGADDDMLQAIWKAGPTSKNAKTATITSATGTPLQATYEEAMGFVTLQGEPDLGRKLRMVTEFEQRFPNSQLLSYVYTQAARVYQQQGDLAKTAEYGERSLKLDPNNIFSMLIVATTLPQPRVIQSNPSQASGNLSTAETNANQALKLIDALEKRPNETDEQFQKRKGALAVDAHTGLGLVYMERGESAKAIDEFKAAMSLSEKPNPQLYFRIGEIYANDGKKHEAIEAFTKASELSNGTVLQTLADKRIVDLKKE